MDSKEVVLAKEEIRIASEYQWWPDIKKLSDNRLAPLEERTFQMSFKDQNQRATLLSIRAEHWRISQKNLEYHNLQDLVPAFRVVFEEKYTLKDTSR